MAQNDRSGLQTALEAAHKIGAAARIAKAAMLAGLKGAAVAAVKETAPFLLKLAIGLLIAVVLVPMFVFTALPNMFFGYENAEAEAQITMREQALTVGGAYMSLETFEQTYRDSIVTGIVSEYQNQGTEIDAIQISSEFKILEILPVNFYLKSPNDQQNIITAYASYLKIAPDSMSCEVRTLPADTSDYVEQMRRCMEAEPNAYCREEIADNIEQIGQGIASESIRHRFFLVFQYEAKMRAKRNTVKGIIQRLNEEADTARRYLDICELEVLEPRFSDDFALKLLYDLINKATSLRVKLPEGVFDMTTAVHGIYEE